VANGGVLKLDSRRQAIQDQYPLQIVKGKDGKPAAALAGYVPNVDQTFGGYFGPSKPAPSRSYPPCKKAKLPWQGKIRVIKNGVITNQTIK
jgi:branched-chain amino acid transport system substrate-binding protein